MDSVILTTGGTGGHIFPALAVAEEIRRRNPQAMILFMGGQYGREADLAVNAGLDFVGLPVRGVMGRGVKGLFSAFGMMRGVAKALSVMSKVKPDLVVGFGGYAAFAGVLAGRISGRKTAIHEQNAYPGMANRLLGKVVDRVFLSAPDTGSIFAPEKCRLVGNPVRAGIAALYGQHKEAMENAAAPAKSRYGVLDVPSPFGPRPGPVAGEDLPEPEPVEAAVHGTKRSPRLLVMGGSLGARALNDGMIAGLNALLEAGVDIWHQTGQTDFERVKGAYREAKAEHVRLESFIMDMPRAYAWADLALCRAGASTMAELTVAGLPSVLVPFPQAAQDHQRHNARFLEKEGGAVLLEQENFLREPELLPKVLLSLLLDTERLSVMSRLSFAQARPFAAERLVDGLEALMGSQKR